MLGVETEKTNAAFWRCNKWAYFGVQLTNGYDLGGGKYLRLVYGRFDGDNSPNTNLYIEKLSNKCDNRFFTFLPTDQLYLGGSPVGIFTGS